jgi:hypothetical protein
MQSEGECENVGMDTPHAVDVYIVITVTTGIRALEPWLATRAPGRATGSAYSGYSDNGDMRRHWLKEKEQRVTLFLAW